MFSLTVKRDSSFYWLAKLDIVTGLGDIPGLIHLWSFWLSVYYWIYYDFLDYFSWCGFVSQLGLKMFWVLLRAIIFNGIQPADTKAGVESFAKVQQALASEPDTL